MKISILLRAATSLLFSATIGGGSCFAQSSDADLAKKLANPIASLISVPIKTDYNFGYGSEDGTNITTSIQPVIPFKLSDDLSLVTRTILPIIWQDDIAGNSGTQAGLGDTLQSFFLVPNSRNTALGDLTYGIGPAVTWATSTDRLLGSGTWGLGPTGVFLFQKVRLDLGRFGDPAVGNSRDAQQRSGVEPNAACSLSSLTQPRIIGPTRLNTESSYNWTSEEWSVPINFTVSKLTRIGEQPVQLQAGVRYWADSPAGGPEGFGARTQISFIFPGGG